jgi:phage baseplate assembly protein W
MATRQYIDLDLGFEVHPVKKDLLSLKDAEAIKNSVRNLVLGQNYERKFHPEIGSLVTSMLFENATPITAVSIKHSIENVLTNFERRIKIKQITVNVSPDENGYNAIIEFYILNTLEPVIFDIYLERTR